MRGGTQYYLEFKSDNEFDGWYDDIYRMSPLAPILVIPEELPEDVPDVEEIIDFYLISHASSPSTILPEPFNNESYPSARQHSPLNLQISSTPNLLDATDIGRDTRNMSPMDVYEITADERVLLRKAIAFLCSCMEPRLRRRSDPGGEKPFDLVEIRLRVLMRVMNKWTTQYDPQVDYETILAFSESLKDGYVLCQDNVNLAKFLSGCRDLGIPREELFISGDLTAITADSSIRVAQTILALVKLTGTHNREKTGQSLRKFSKTTLPSFASSDIFVNSRINKKSLRYEHVPKDEHVRTDILPGRKCTDSHDLSQVLKVPYPLPLHELAIHSNFSEGLSGALQVLQYQLSNR
ncbi:hypothetical protein J3R30DRAFT_1570542 [Lentinula aciculospora]|uniref:Uncharacterized protein n=1 Tax=Lentinula aciculospora TaxID=153920 RepID=A0A9W8ZXH1_9AGAR|nr:hypothetical protein J3R30DRAFT_1570542 [Lentinula aciculospora]